MAFIIIITTIIIYLVMIAWTWSSLGYMEKIKKVLFIGIGLVVIWFVTLLVISISQGGIEFQETEIASQVKNMLTLVFTGINSLAFLPICARIFSKVQEGDMDKIEFRNKIIILTVVIILLMSIECNYMKSTQEGILRIYQSMKK